MSHPLDAPRLARRLSGLRSLCMGLMLLLIAITFGIWMVVHYALDSLPLSGHLITVGGLALPTVVAGALTLIVPFVALRVGRSRGEAGVRALAAESEDDEAEKLLDVFAGRTFAEYAVAGGYGFVCSLVFHLTSDPLMLIWIGALTVFMAVRYPTTARAKAWYDAATEQLARERRSRTL